MGTEACTDKFFNINWNVEERKRRGRHEEPLFLALARSKKAKRNSSLPPIETVAHTISATPTAAERSRLSQPQLHPNQAYHTTYAQ